MADIPIVPEIDQHGGDELPTYDDLAAQNGPNSRYVLTLSRIIYCPFPVTEIVPADSDAGENG